MDKQKPKQSKRIIRVLYYNLNKYGDAKDIFLMHRFIRKVYHQHTRGC
jgi:hypothetical protein